MALRQHAVIPAGRAETNHSSISGLDRFVEMDRINCEAAGLQASAVDVAHLSSTTAVLNDALEFPGVEKAVTWV